MAYGPAQMPDLFESHGVVSVGAAHQVSTPSFVIDTKSRVWPTPHDELILMRSIALPHCLITSITKSILSGCFLVRYDWIWLRLFASNGACMADPVRRSWDDL